ncbi:hypothetical protein SDRG_09412 [Saprolegnia diclina VS20]|uniref:Uncharacterized protein n=1 Tax=Saprolegnia diclina (strain VS20) TaxID=1156394 RepID=T0QDR9_SAPDV|nr:hypothetical protein SDRG_09412 [Saprolegnia diclina VS20]EQC32881.1 hypothetical protein SDRG_09412 [Saprolegnia diclina VS20]|eukprot:XP_008613567.1 hypothetical protein SDRG_09412 [Saprolegnia diclina VS20]
MLAPMPPTMDILKTPKVVSPLGVVDENVNQGAWSKEEHERFLIAVQLYPEGPWKAVAEIIQTRNAKQAQTHMQKCKEKLQRRFKRTSSADSDDIEPYVIHRSKHSQNLRIPELQPIPFDHRLAMPGSLLSDCSISIDAALDFFLQDMTTATSP